MKLCLNYKIIWKVKAGYMQDDYNFLEYMCMWQRPKVDMENMDFWIWTLWDQAYSREFSHLWKDESI